MARGDLMELPVHAGAAAVEDLHAVHADVAIPGIRVLGVDGGEGDEGAAILRPAFEDGEIGEIKGGGARLIEADDDVLARPGADVGGAGVDDFEAFAEEGPGLAERLGRLGFEEEGDLVGDFVDVADFEGEGHAPLGTEGVDQDGEGGDFSVRKKRLFDEEGFAAAGRFHFAISEGGDFEFGANRFGDADEFTGGGEVIGEGAHGGKSHGGNIAKSGGCAVI